MDLVTCPSCEFTFSPTPGKAVKCPACMKVIAPADSWGDVAAGPPAALPTITPQPDPSPTVLPESDGPAPASNVGLILGGAALLLLIGLGAGILIARTMSPPAPNHPIPKPIAQAKPPDDLPVIAKIAPPIVEPTPDPIEPKVPPKIFPKVDDPPPKTPTIRPVDPVAPPLFKEYPEGVTRQKIDEAVQKGVAHLVATSPQWLRSDQFPLGYAALGGWTLLECKTPPSHPVVQKAAETVRRLAPRNDKTYEVSLALLFLDRLGDSRDRGLIQSLGARLVAGQQPSGGFTYTLGPALTSAENAELLHFLRFTRPSGAASPLAVLEQPSDDEPRDKLPGDVFDPFAAGGRMFTDPIDPRPGNAPAPGDISGLLVSTPPKILPRTRLSAEVGTMRLPSGGGTATNPALLSPPLQRVPAVVNQGREKDQMILSLGDGAPSDHSSLQFALLGLWTARRHGVVSDRALLLAEARMRKLQRADGFWNFDTDNSPKPSMICSGVLALALGHAVHPNEGLAAAISRDASIRLAMDRLAVIVAEPEPAIDRDIAPSYFFWSMGRIAVMLNASTLGGKDWYGSGAQTLLRRQDAHGAWSLGGFFGSSPHVDTCLALLFLTRSDPVREITDQLRP